MGSACDEVAVEPAIPDGVDVGVATPGEETAAPDRVGWAGAENSTPDGVGPMAAATMPVREPATAVDRTLVAAVPALVSSRGAA